MLRPAHHLHFTRSTNLGSAVTVTAHHLDVTEQRGILITVIELLLGVSYQLCPVLLERLTVRKGVL